MFKKITFALLSVLVLMPTATQTGSGGAWAGGLIGGALIGSALTAASQPRTVYVEQPARTVVYSDNTSDSNKASVRKLREENKELRQKLHEMESKVDQLINSK